jgi:hypothetical protein
VADVLDGIVPSRWDHELVIGDTYQVILDLTDADTGTALDLSAVTAGTAKLRAEAGGEVILTPTVDLTDKATGVVSWSASNTATASLTPQTCVYAVQLTSAVVKTVVEGRVLIRRSAVS